MGAHSWYHVDDLRKSWAFLLLNSAGTGTNSVSSDEVEYWEIGIGNADSLVSKTVSRIDLSSIPDETRLLQELLSELQPLRYQNVILLTLHQQTIHRLRRRLVKNSVEKPSLRGFSHISLENQIETYFAQNLSDYDLQPEGSLEPKRMESGQLVCSENLQQFWEVWTDVFRLIPASELTGDSL